MQLQEICTAYSKKQYFKSVFFIISLIWIFGIVSFGAISMYEGMMRQNQGEYTGIVEKIFDYKFTPEILVALFIFSFYLMFIKIPRKIKMSDTEIRIGRKRLPLQGLSIEYARWYNQNIGISGTVVYFLSGDEVISIAAPELMFSENAYTRKDTSSYQYYVKESEQLEYLLSYLQGYTNEKNLPESAEQDLASGRTLKLLLSAPSDRTKVTAIALVIFFGGFSLLSVFGIYVINYMISQEIVAYSMSGGMIAIIVLLIVFVILSPRLIGKHYLIIEKNTMTIKKGRPFKKTISASLRDLSFEVCEWHASVQGSGYYVGPALRINNFNNKSYLFGTSTTTMKAINPQETVEKTDYIMGSPQFKLLLQKLKLSDQLERVKY